MRPPQCLYDTMSGKQPIKMIPTLEDVVKDEQALLNASINSTAANVRFAVLDKDFRIGWASAQFCETFGRTESDLMGESLSHLDGMLHTSMFQTLFPIVSTGVQWSGELRYDTPFGDRVWLQTHLLPIHADQDSGHQLYLFLINDITDTKVALQEKQAALTDLRYSEARYRALIENQSDLIALFNVHGDRIYVNSKYQDFTGKSFIEIIGTNIYEFTLKGVPLSFIRQAFLLTPDNPEISKVFELENARQEKQWILLYVRGIFDSFGNLYEFMSIGRNVTDLKHAELQKTDYIEALERIAFMTSHRVRSPISTMQGLLELLRMDAVDADQWELVRHALKRCVDDLDKYSRELGDFIYHQQFNN
jgi:PAS domain S-box-containing protein